VILLWGDVHYRRLSHIRKRREQDNHEEVAARAASVTILSMRIRLLPPSTEGFRRLAKAMAVVAFAATIAYWVHDHSKWQAHMLKTFEDINRDLDQACIAIAASAKSQECLAVSEKAFQEGISSVSERSWSVTIRTWGRHVA
jgi:predicted nuclease with RNAse H fold